MELTSSDVVNAIRSQNRLVPSGKVGGAPAPDDQQYTFTIQLQGRLTSEDEFRDLVIKTTDDGGLIRLRDVGEVELGGNSYEISAVNLEGNPAVSMAISQLAAVMPWWSPMVSSRSSRNSKKRCLWA